MNNDHRLKNLLKITQYVDFDSIYYHQARQLSLKIIYFRGQFQKCVNCNFTRLCNFIFFFCTMTLLL